MVAEGHLNAVAFWFDLHLDDQVSITSAPAGFGHGGAAVEPNPIPPAYPGPGDVMTDRSTGAPAGTAAPAAASAGAGCASAAAATAAADVAAPRTSLGGPSVMVDSQGINVPCAAAGAADSQAACALPPAAASTPGASAAGGAAACAPHTAQAAAAKPSGRELGSPPEPAPDVPGGLAQAAACSAPAVLGVGAVLGAAPCAGAGAANPAGLGQGAVPGAAPCAGAGDANPAGLRQEAVLKAAPCAGAADTSGAGGVAGGCVDSGFRASAAQADQSGGGAEPHYWGQALQYLDCSTPIAPGELMWVPGPCFPSSKGEHRDGLQDALGRPQQLRCTCSKLHV